MVNLSGPNRLEVERQILVTSLRHSWSDGDIVGLELVWTELSQIYPDLTCEGTPPAAANCYHELQLGFDVSQSMILAAYFRTVKKFLRENPNPRKNQKECFRLMNAGFILRKPRLRISHDFFAVKRILAEAAAQANAARTEYSHETISTTDNTATDTIPLMLELLTIAKLIGPLETKALQNQSKLYPDISIRDLVLHSEYVSKSEMVSIELAESLIRAGKLTKEQFAEQPGIEFFLAES